MGSSLATVARISIAFALAGLSAGACGDARPPDVGLGGDASAPSPDGAPPSSTSPGPTSSPGTTPPDACAPGEAVCLAKDRRRACTKAEGEGARWVEETCAAGRGCFQGACVVGKCSDECTLGETAGGKTCAPWDVATRKPVAGAPATKLHDRARGYLGRMKKESMASGAIGSARYEDASLTKITFMDGIGDSAIWTGAFLASEALRLRATGSADARARVRSLTEILHLFMNVSGEPGLLSRWAQVSGTKRDYVIGDLDCAATRVHCGIPYAGKTYDVIGHISRDQYQGVMLGLALAYEALGSADEDLRELVRRDVVTFVKELMKERTLPVRLTFNGVPITSNVTARFVVTSPREMKNGAIDLRIDLGKLDDSEMFGFQEFYPNLAHLVRQLPGLAWVPDLPRASSAIMLASFFRVALRVTENVPSYAKDRAEILAYYTSNKGQGGNARDWLAIAGQWSDSASGCAGNYYANNIAMMPMYNLARLEDDPARKKVVVDDILGSKMWPRFATTKNSFFAFLYAGTTPGVAPGVISAASAQLAQFPPAPRVMRPVDLRSDPRYASRDTSCADHVSHAEAVDVGDRVTADFLWQRHPWGLYEAGDLRATQPGVDFLIAYFLGRHLGFLDDDTKGACLAWQ
ncbi:MAG: hypothetical protein JST00_09640 [Deltaproteobacteria bacterium]|nr:hypothetical protein [Deltaproteobacteria bacterium]